MPKLMRQNRAQLRDGKALEQGKPQEQIGTAPTERAESRNLDHAGVELVREQYAVETRSPRSGAQVFDQVLECREIVTGDRDARRFRNTDPDGAGNRKPEQEDGRCAFENEVGGGTPCPE